MTELVDGLQLSLSQLHGGLLTYLGKPVKFELVNPEQQVFQAKTELTEEQKAAGNSAVIFTFTLDDAFGKITKTVVPVSQEEQQDSMKHVMQQRSKQESKQQQKQEEPLPVVEVGLPATAQTTSDSEVDTSSSTKQQNTKANRSSEK